MSGLLIMEAANLFCGDHDPNNSKHLTLSELALPELQEMFADHHAGGSRLQIEVPTGIQKLTPSFKLAGWDPEVLPMFGLNSRATNHFTAYGVLRDRATGVAQEAKAVMRGRLGKVGPEAFQRGEMQGHDYEINAVVHYELWVNGAEKFFFDFFSSEWRVDGVAQNDDERSILQIPTV
jgi:hypothetical protein